MAFEGGAGSKTIAVTTKDPLVEGAEGPGGKGHATGKYTSSMEMPGDKSVDGGGDGGGGLRPPAKEKASSGSGLAEIAVLAGRKAQLGRMLRLRAMGSVCRVFVVGRVGRRFVCRVEGWRVEETAGRRRFVCGRG